MNKVLLGSIACAAFLAACGGGTEESGDCTKETAAAFCDRMADQGKVCGQVTGTNNCTQEARTEDCGTAACTGTTPECDGASNTCVAACSVETTAAFCDRMAGQGMVCGFVVGTNNCTQEARTEDCGTTACTGTTPECDEATNSCVTSCTVETTAAFCDRMAGQGKVCGHVTNTNNCTHEARTEDCGTAACTGTTPECDGTTNSCVANCTVETTAAFCSRMAGQGKVCGDVTDTNNCTHNARTEDCGIVACTGATPECDDTSNTCVAACTVETAAAFCSRMAGMGKVCGHVTDTNNCTHEARTEDCGTAVCSDGTQCEMDSNRCVDIDCPSDFCNGHGTCSTSSGNPICTCHAGYASPTCATCADDYTLEGGACIHTKQVPCTNAAPANATSTPGQVTVTYSTVGGGWSVAADCPWTCDSGYRLQDGLCVPSEVGTECSPSVVISQVYGGGGSPATNCDFVELHNRADSPVAITGWTVQYASATGTWSGSHTLSGTISAGGYFLVRLACGSTPDISNQDSSGTINLSGTTGKVALVNGTATLTSCTSSTIIDLVGYGTNANCSEGTRAPAPSSSTSLSRAGNGCTDTNNNSVDFTVGPPAPRNSNSAASACVCEDVIVPTDCTVLQDYGTVTTVYSEGEDDLPDYAYGGFDLNYDYDTVQLELVNGYGAFTGGIRTGTFTISGADLNYGSCGLCVLLFGDEYSAVHNITSGTVTISQVSSGRLVGTLTNATFEEVTIDENTLVSTPVPGGCRSRIGSMAFATDLY